MISPSDILYEDNHLLILNKAVSEIVQGDKTGDTSLDDKVKAFIKVRDNKPGNVYLGVPHRLDRPVSGVLVYCKTSKSLSRMNEIFRNQESEKIYWAIVKELPPKTEDVLENYLRKNEKQNKSYLASKDSRGAKYARLEYKLLRSIKTYHLLEIKLSTGRHHQIRAQLSAAGSPIKGDLKYGFPRSNPDAGISLHARSIRFTHPVKKEEVFLEAPPPPGDLFKHFFE